MRTTPLEALVTRLKNPPLEARAPAGVTTWSSRHRRGRVPRGSLSCPQRYALLGLLLSCLARSGLRRSRCRAHGLLVFGPCSLAAAARRVAALLVVEAQDVLHEARGERLHQDRDDREAGGLRIDHVLRGPALRQLDARGGEQHQPYRGVQEGRLQAAEPVRHHELREADRERAEDVPLEVERERHDARESEQQHELEAVLLGCCLQSVEPGVLLQLLVAEDLEFL
mmetsp:Transcript_55833/g.145193  ORF Transcript_55833/g.145193 Transcript_55833/m.145193 type:complete len:226 (-) Transcript_55833:738-1415(-)